MQTHSTPNHAEATGVYKQPESRERLTWTKGSILRGVDL